MRIRRIGVRKEYRLKFWSIVSLIFIICLVFIPKSNRAFLKNLFSDKCINYQQVYSRKLNDRIVDYSAKARLTGITALMNENDIRQSVIRREIVKVRNGRNYKVENLTNNYPYLTRDSKTPEKIGRRFRKKISSEGFKDRNAIITSMTRTRKIPGTLGSQILMFQKIVLTSTAMPLIFLMQGFLY